jgi:hypothetical protein
MKISVFSEKASEKAKNLLDEEEKIDWHKEGSNIQYRLSKITREFMEEGEIK